MKLEFIAHDKLVPAKVNMRFAKKPPDVTDILPSVRSRGIVVPLLVRPATASPGLSEIVAGLRRWTADAIVRAEGIDHGPLPCAILDEGDDAAAIEASLIENVARLDPDEVTQWETFVRLVKEGRPVDDIATTFALSNSAIRRILALGNLLPRIRTLYRAGEIDRTTVRHLTLASKSQQKAWLALLDDPDAYVPSGHQLKDWLFGGQSISTEHALFDVAASGLAVVADLFEERGFFGDADAFWTAQEAAIEAARSAYLASGWSDVVLVPATEHFQAWEYEKTPKRKGGRVFVDVRRNGEVVFHEGYVTRAEARRADRGGDEPSAKPRRPELTSAMQTYVDLHVHAATRAALLAHPAVALRLMVAHAIAGSALWTLRAEPQASRDDAVRESIETSRGETVFDEHRRAVLALLGFADDEPTVLGGHRADWPKDSLSGIFARLIELPDPAVMDVIAIVMGETLAAGSAAVLAAGAEIGIAMADWWQADDAFFSLLRDKEVLGRMVAEVAGETVADANRTEKGTTLKRIVADHLEGSDGRPKADRWVPRWMRVPPSDYTERGRFGAAVTTLPASAPTGPDLDEEAVPLARAA